jgi:PTH1 family peptidyl-tRNA hydrolase
MVLDEAASRLGVAFTREKFRALAARTAFRGDPVLLLKPLTYMNHSGESVALAARKLRAVEDDLLVVADDVNLPLGKLRLRAKGSSGGHKGLQSIIERVGTTEFPRLRIGVGDSRNRSDLTEFVLGRFTPDEVPEIEAMVARGADAVLAFLESGIASAMNQFN